jgi:hypothetical protein
MHEHVSSRPQGRRIAGGAILCALATILGPRPAQAQSLPADIHISFTTTLTAVRAHNPRMLGAVEIFPIKVNLYESLPADYAFTSFALSPFKVSLPAAGGAIAVTGTIEYQAGPGTRAELCRFSGTLGSVAQTLNCTSSQGFATFAAALQHDVLTTDKTSRTLEKVLFIVTIGTASPGGAPSPATIDVGIVFAALAKTTFRL